MALSLKQIVSYGAPAPTPTSPADSKAKSASATSTGAKPLFDNSFGAWLKQQNMTPEQAAGNAAATANSYEKWRAKTEVDAKKAGYSVTAESPVKYGIDKHTYSQQQGIAPSTFGFGKQYSAWLIQQLIAGKGGGQPLVAAPVQPGLGTGVGSYGTGTTQAITPESLPSQYQAILAEANANAAQQTAATLAAQSGADALAQQAAAREAMLSPYAESLGQTERSEIERQRSRLLSQVMQQMISRGLTGTTALDAARREVERLSASEMGNLEGQITKERMDYLSSLSGETLGARSAAADFATQGAQQRFDIGVVPLGLQQQLLGLTAQQGIAGMQYGLDYAKLGQQTALGYAQLQQANQQAEKQRAMERSQLVQGYDLERAKIQSEQKDLERQLHEIYATSKKGLMKEQAKRIKRDPVSGTLTINNAW